MLPQVHSGHQAAAATLHHAEGGSGPNAGPAHHSHYQTRMDDIDIEEGELDEEDAGTSEPMDTQRWAVYCTLPLCPLLGRTTACRHASPFLPLW